MTVDVFRGVMQSHEEVDVAKAVQAGADPSGAVTTTSSSGSSSSSASGARTLGATAGDAFEEEGRNRLSAQEILLTLPGVTIHNFRAIMNNVTNLAALSEMSEAALTALIGPTQAAKLYDFFRKKVTFHN